MKKTVSLIVAIVMSLTVFVSNIAGLSMIVKAADESVVYDEPGDIIMEEPASDPAPGQAEEPVITPQEEPQQPRQSEQEKAEEAARQAAYEQAAKEAEEAAKKQQEEDEAAAAAKKKAEEEEQRIKKEKEEAAKAAEEQKKKEEESNYSIAAYVNGTTVTAIDFGSAPTGTMRDYRELRIFNAGKTAVDLIYTKADDADKAFSINLTSADAHIEPGEAAIFDVGMSSGISAGDYTARLMFADSKKDPNYSKGLSVKLKGSVTSVARVTSVEVTPSRAMLAVGNTFEFYANVKGNGNVSQDVIWSVTNQNASGTTISPDGRLNIDKNETSGSITVIATSDMDRSIKGYATVTPQRNSYNVNVTVSPKNGGTVTGGGAIAQGGSTTLYAAPKNNFYFAGWFINGKRVSGGSSYDVVNAQGNVDIVAKFGQNYVTVNANVNNSNGGNVVGGGNISYGGSTTLSAKAYDGYVFTGWKEGDNIISRDASIRLDNLTVNRTITAIFDRTSHTLTLAASPVEGGTVTGGGTFALNQGTVAKATPASGYTFQGWAINGQIVNRNPEVRIDRLEQDYSCTAIFIKTGVTTFEMSSGVATTGGTISPSGKIVVAQGQNLTYTITPKAGFAILAVAVDGVQVGPVSTYTFSNINGNHTIAAAFLQTDAGKAAAASAGKPVQEKKVEKIVKVSANTATQESTVNIEEAVNGEAGDDYVEEMELDNVVVPTDEQLGISQSVVDEYSEIASILGVSKDEAKAMAAAGNSEPVLTAAFYAGNLAANVTNSYEPVRLNGVDYSGMTREELQQVARENIYPSLPNFSKIVERMFTNDEVVSLVDGGSANVSVSITKAEDPGDNVKKVMRNAVGQKPLSYFDLTMMKTLNGYAQNVTDLSEPIEVIMEIPDDVYKSGKVYSVLRVHDGEVAVLPDLDDDPKTVTFKTDRFSSYAIAEEKASISKMVMTFTIGASVALAIALICMFALVTYQSKARRARVRARRAAERNERNEKE